MTQSTRITTTSLLAAATEVLTNGDYVVVPGIPEWSQVTVRLFEDVYNVVGVVVFETVHEMLRDWTDLQAALVGVMSGGIRRGESKSWDGYLVLLTPAISPSEGERIERLRYDTKRLRKIVATGDDLQTPADVQRVLSGLLPLSITHTAELADPSSSALLALPHILESGDSKIPAGVTQALIDSFRAQSSLLETLFQLEGE